MHLNTLNEINSLSKKIQNFKVSLTSRNNDQMKQEESVTDPYAYCSKHSGQDFMACVDR